MDADQVIARLRPAFAHDPRAAMYLQASQDIRVGGRSANAQYQYTLQGDDMAALNQWAPKLVARLRQEPIVADVNTDQQNSGLDVRIDIDRDTAARLGVSANSIDQALYDAFGQRQVSTMYEGLNQYRVVMEVAPEYWQQPETLNAMYVAGTNGTLVPLSTIARFGRSTSPLSISHQSQFPAVTLSFNLRRGASLGDAVTAINRAARDIGMPVSIHGSFQGTARVFQQSLRSEPWLIAAALAAVYIVLGILYESLVHPFTILSTLPSAGAGAMLALAITRTEFTVIALIGLILLIGIVKKNAIMMIDVALETERREGIVARRGDSQGITAPAAADPDDDDGRDAGCAADCTKQRHRSRAPSSARYFDHRWIDRESIADAVHDAGALRRDGSVANAAHAMAGSPGGAMARAEG